jgi:3-deoxy-D-manno-octulosonic-acid transferase
MIPVYNFLQFCLLLIGFPVIAALVLGRGKYRRRIGQRLGLGLHRAVTTETAPERKTIWIHCLSVGEVTSAVPFVSELRRRLPNAAIVLSIATETGMEVAVKKIGSLADAIIAGPLDLRPSLRRFINRIGPNLFILVETDFWPNWLDCLRRRHIPAMLINGRISVSSFRKYTRFRFFFTPLFDAFSLLAMQTANDAEQIRKLGAPIERIAVLGNLKYDTVASLDTSRNKPLNRSQLHLAENSIVWICGSTHGGEEEIILSAFSCLREEFPRLALVVAPRDPVRAGEIAGLAEKNGLRAVCRTAPGTVTTRLLILDTIGELAECYHLAHAAFIGGSLVNRGGHNPLEAAVHGVPVLFGPHMEDFHEIAAELVREGGVRTVLSVDEMTETVRSLLIDSELHGMMSRAADRLIARRKGVVNLHIDAALDLLNPS